jgi:hypothetical protein
VNLKNYTSDIPASKTVANIESYLAQCGISGIMKEYRDGRVVALVFQAPDTNGSRTIKLPSDVEGTHDFLWEQYQAEAKRPRRSKEDFAEQAERTAWKVMDDWVRVQMTLIAVQKKSVTEVFLPYVMVSKTQTFFEKIQTNNYKALLPEKSEAV